MMLVRFTSVVAVEVDKHLYQKGLFAIEPHKDDINQFPKIISVLGDMNFPLSVPDLKVLRNPLDTIFCNFALHYFWESQDQTATFLQNLLPHLAERGRVVITILQGEVLQNGPIQVFSGKNNCLEFEVNLLNSKSASVYVASIGVAHVEGVIMQEELKRRFENTGLELVLWLPFDNLLTLSREKLSENEIKMSSMYAAAVFEKRGCIEITPIKALFFDKLPKFVEKMYWVICRYLI